MTRRPALLVAAALAAVGFVLAVVLARQHAQAHAGIVSFCSINEYLNCDRVATSRFSVVLGLPVAVWGMLGYGLALLLALAGLRPDRRREVWPAGLLLLVAGAAVAAAVALAVISEVVIGALCLLCAASWATAFGLFAAAWRACRPEGVLRAVRGDLAVLRDRPLRTLVVFLAALAVVFLVATVFPRYWARPPKGTAAVSGGTTGGGAATGSPAVAPPHGPIVVVEFSDYECPFCALAHEQTKALLAKRPDVLLVRRQFPLDSDCNPAVTRRMHPQACALARAGICAESQGRLEPMDDALFKNQKAGRPVEELATAVGLDLPRFRACLASQETELRLRSDIEAGVRAGLKATPTFVVGGQAHAGLLTPDVLPPPRAPGIAGQ